MPIPIAVNAIFDGLSTMPTTVWWLKLIPAMSILVTLKWYFQGNTNTSERSMHAKVVLVTGGTSGIGAEVVLDLATRGAQIVLLTQTPLNDPFLVDYIEDVRMRSNNELISAERVDLTSLHSIRTFATKWIDNAPPRRLDMVILCANTITPRGGKVQSTEDDVEINWGLNYLANFHLLSILSPAIRAQPADRDVRIIMGTCASYLGGELPVEAPATVYETGTKRERKPATKAAPAKPVSANVFNPGSAYASSKLALMTFAQAFQKHLSSYDRPDKLPMNSRVLLVDPGFTRTPGMRRYLTWGSLFGLFIYLVTYPLWWMVLKSPDMGAQSFLYAAMEARYGRGDGGWLIKECKEIGIGRDEVKDEALQKALWEYSESMVQEAERRGALARSKAKKEQVNESDVKAEANTKEAASKQPGSRRSRKT